MSSAQRLPQYVLTLLMLKKRIKASFLTCFTAQWRQEFILGLPNSHSKLELRVLDWNRFASNKTLGSVVIDLHKLRFGTFYDEWRPLDTQGELRVMIKLSPLSIASPQSLNLKLPKCRVHLESAEYYPGQTLRGYFVMSASKSRKFSNIKILIEGASSAVNVAYQGQAILFASAGTLVGEVNETSLVYSLGEGLFIFPFECALPLNLTHTYNSGAPAGINSIGANVNLYRVIASIELMGSIPQHFITPFRVLAHPMHAVVDPAITIAPSTKEALVAINLQGPSVAWRGEAFPLTVSIQNNSTSTIDHIVVRLKIAHWISGKRFKPKWKRFGGTYRLEVEWNFPIDPSPIAPGQNWTNTVSIAIPAKGELSVLSTLSPLLQIGHILTVKALSSDKSSIPSNGNKKLPITVSDHYPSLDHIEAPVEPFGSVGRIIVALATPEMSSKIVPAPSVQSGELNYIGGTSDSIVALPGARTSNPIPHTTTFGTVVTQGYYLTDTEWTPGSVPAWIDPAKVGIYDTKSR